MIYELYINGIICDLPGDSAISLLYQSPIFSGLDAIQSNRSYNIALPITPKNRGAIEFAERPDIDSDIPYIKLPASLYQDGTPIFTQGYAVVTDITDTINVTLTWGNVNNFQPLFDSSLRDLGPELLNMGVAGIPWNGNSTIRTSNNTDDSVAVDFIGVDFGKGLSDPKYIHPSASVKYLLYAIESHNGIKIENIERLWGNLSPAPILPLVSKNGDEISGKAETTVGVFKPVNASGYTILQAASISQHPEYIVGTTYDVQDATYIEIQISSGEALTSLADDDIRSLDIAICSGSNFEHALAYVRVETFKGTDGWLVQVPQTTIILKKAANNLPKDGSISIVFANKELASKLNNMSVSVIMVAAPRKEVNFPSIFPVTPNLPDMSQGDFILALMSMNGLFAYADKDEPNTIKLISIDDIFDNINNGDVVDWSNRVIVNNARDVSRPESSAFTIDDFAQKNILDYDNDDEINTDTAGIITVDNVNIDKETELVELPFSASRNGVSLEGVNCAWIPIYEDNKQGGVNYSECSPRIVAWRTGQILNGRNICTGIFEKWMEFGGETGIVKSKYASYQKIVERLRMITIRAKLTPLDLYNLDYTKPVYISQFGQLYAVFSVEPGDDDICECRLLKLKPTYFIRIEGDAAHGTIRINAAAQTVAVPYKTNGTLVVGSQMGWATSVVIGEAEILIAMPENAVEYGKLSSITLYVDEDHTITRTISIYQEAAETGYYLRINGKDEDYTIMIDNTNQHVYIPFETNGTLKMGRNGGMFPVDPVVEGGNIKVLIMANTSSQQRIGVITVALAEALEIQHNIIITQSGVDQPNPSVSFSKSLPWEAETTAVAMDNDGNVDLEVLSLPDWTREINLPYELVRGKSLAIGIYANTTGELRTGVVDMRYLNVGTGQYVDYRVEISQRSASTRMVIVDTSIDPSLKGLSIMIHLLLLADGAYGELEVEVGDDNNIRLSFEQIADSFGYPNLEDYAGDTLRIYMLDGISGEAQVPATGDIYITLK